MAKSANTMGPASKSNSVVTDLDLLRRDKSAHSGLKVYCSIQYQFKAGPAIIVYFALLNKIIPKGGLVVMANPSNLCQCKIICEKHILTKKIFHTGDSESHGVSVE